MMARLVVLLSLAVAGVSLWVAAAPVAGRLFGQGAVSAGSMAAVPEPPVPEAADLGAVLDAAPFGHAEAAFEIVGSAAPEGAFVLLGITVARDKAASRAIIAGGDRPVANYGVGSEIMADVVLREVHPDHVVLGIRGQDQDLGFPPGNGEGLPLLSPFVADTVPDAAAAETLIGRYRTDLQQDPDGLMERLGLAVTDAGYLVTAAAADDVLRAGLRPDDIVTDVNGTSLRGLPPDAGVLDRVAALGSANLSVLRGDRTILMTFPLP